MREIDTGVQEAFIKEVNEDLKNESMKKMWDKYGLYIIILVVAALTAAVSFEAIKAWYTKKLQTWSDSYAYALSLQNQGKYDESIDTFDYIAGKDYGIFSDLAKMQKANILLEQKKNDEAFKLMNEIIEDKSFNPQLRDTTILKLASYKLDNAPAEEIESLLNPLIAANGSWVNIAKEMKAMLAIREENLELAKEIYNDILSDEKLPDSMKARVEDMLSVLNETQANSTK